MIRDFLNSIKAYIPTNRIYTDELRRSAWGTDASCYSIQPGAVIISRDEKEVTAVLREATAHGIPVTFRAAGTSLSGQAISNSILLVAGKNWERWSLSKDAETITMQPGIIGTEVNRILGKHGRRFGPDPASINSCMIGGIVANNASGMSCGTHANSDKTLVSARIVFMDGSILDTADNESCETFRQTHPALFDELESIRQEILKDKELYERLKYKYSIKNVTGLNLRPFLEYDNPFELIAHLMVGSEGTLGFISEVTMLTLPIARHKACAMLYFPDKQTAAKAVVAMKKQRVSAAELLDLRSLTAVSDEHLKSAACRDLTAVLTETSAESEEELKTNIEAITRIVSEFPLMEPVAFTDDAETVARYWKLRSGIFPMVGGMRKEGTTCIIEDVAFHIEDLPQAVQELSDLLDRHGYYDSCIYGHALEGNFHFIINQSFSTDEEVRRYEAMIRDVVEMVAGHYDGSLKAEHGTGRNMSAFVKTEWGERIYGIMERVKHAFDPDGLLNPCVIFDSHPARFLEDLKKLPELHPGEGATEETLEAFRHINKCIECGFCEVNCVSCGHALSSRTRIAVRRRIQQLENELAGQDIHAKTSSTGKQEIQDFRDKLRKELECLRSQYRLLGEKECAGDGLCSTSCPMGINAADLTHELRRISTGPETFGYKAWNSAANHFSGVKVLLRSTLMLADTGRAVLGEKAMSAVCRGLHDKLSIPLWTPAMPRAYRIRNSQIENWTNANAQKPTVVYLPSCFNQTMGIPAGVKDMKPLVEETVELLQKAGYNIIFPQKMSQLCCGTIWESKGMPDIAQRKLEEVEAALREASQNGKFPILCDQSPCLHRLRTQIKGLKLYEPAEFIWTYLRDRLDITQSDEPVAIHVTCSMRLMGLKDTLYKLAELCSSNVLLPEGVGCCAFAGDKGMTNPDLNRWALRKLRPQIEAAGIRHGYSNSRTCEIGLTANSGIPYYSIVYLVNAHSKKRTSL